MGSALGELKRNPKQMFEAMAEAHGRLLEEKLTEVLDSRGLKLGLDGVELLILNPPDNPETNTVMIVYEIRKNGVMLDTFGWEMDLTAPI
jgi:hypothetical protein